MTTSASVPRNPTRSSKKPAGPGKHSSGPPPDPAAQAQRLQQVFSALHKDTIAAGAPAGGPSAPPMSPMMAGRPHPGPPSGYHPSAARVVAPTPAQQLQQLEVQLHCPSAGNSAQQNWSIHLAPAPVWATTAGAGAHSRDGSPQGVPLPSQQHYNGLPAPSPHNMPMHAARRLPAGASPRGSPRQSRDFSNDAMGPGFVHPAASPYQPCGGRPQWDQRCAQPAAAAAHYAGVSRFAPRDAVREEAPAWEEGAPARPIVMPNPGPNACGNRPPYAAQNQMGGSYNERSLREPQGDTRSPPWGSPCWQQEGGSPSPAGGAAGVRGRPAQSRLSMKETRGGHPHGASLDYADKASDAEEAEAQRLWEEQRAATISSTASSAGSQLYAQQQSSYNEYLQERQHPRNSSGRGSRAGEPEEELYYDEREHQQQYNHRHQHQHQQQHVQQQVHSEKPTHRRRSSLTPSGDVPLADSHAGAAGPKGRSSWRWSDSEMEAGASFAKGDFGDDVYARTVELLAAMPVPEDCSSSSGAGSLEFDGEDIVVAPMTARAAGAQQGQLRQRASPRGGAKQGGNVAVARGPAGTASPARGSPAKRAPRAPPQPQATVPWTQSADPDAQYGRSGVHQQHRVLASGSSMQSPRGSPGPDGRGHARRMSPALPLHLQQQLAQGSAGYGWEKSASNGSNSSSGANTSSGSSTGHNGVWSRDSSLDSERGAQARAAQQTGPAAAAAAAAAAVGGQSLVRCLSDDEIEGEMGRRAQAAEAGRHPQSGPAGQPRHAAAHPNKLSRTLSGSSNEAGPEQRRSPPTGSPVLKGDKGRAGKKSCGAAGGKPKGKKLQVQMSDSEEEARPKAVPKPAKGKVQRQMSDSEEEGRPRAAARAVKGPSKMQRQMSDSEDEVRPKAVTKPVKGKNLQRQMSDSEEEGHKATSRPVKGQHLQRPMSGSEDEKRPKAASRPVKGKPMQRQMSDSEDERAAKTPVNPTKNSKKLEISMSDSEEEGMVAAARRQGRNGNKLQLTMSDSEEEGSGKPKAEAAKTPEATPRKSSTFTAVKDLVVATVKGAGKKRTQKSVRTKKQ